jgi:predicted nucleic acid-binding protein
VFEVERGLHQRGASAQLKTFREQLLPMFAISAPTLIDWRVAAQLWGNARGRGIQFSDVDVLLAAMTLRLGGVLVTDDGDFAHLPLVPTENWLHL